ncbi:hypothetical protein A2409_03650 [Candidatus Curtissbacteria bacterium RIFOXYC1_FULL_41_36]|nr:MAG: hypothetical protein A2409_03650 [Candidatus Curtissbacteria bacterium RIFOXYC1_FULL_41_36]OGE17923.1 MAG: hypothetical protein A2495_01800 [Candidatus Curtissbacteria bacterium RIFOXYC12_FULL_41_11]
MSFLTYFVIIAIVVTLPVLAAVLPKPWWKLDREQKKKRLPFIIAGVVLAGLGIINLITVIFFGN